MTKNHLAHHKWEILGLTAVLLLAAFLRLGFPGINSFGFDEARVSHMALQMARGGQFAQMGMQSSTSVPNLPAAVWIFALPYWLTPDPLGANLFIGLVGVTAVLGIWWLARQAWGSWAGFAVALLLAASPMAVAYSRSVWSQDLLVPFTIFWALAGVAGIAQGGSAPKRAWALALHVFLAGFTLQIHFAAIPLLIGTAWLGIRYRLWRQWKPVLVGGLLALLAALPYAQIIWCCGPGAQADWRTLLSAPNLTNPDIFSTLAEVGAAVNWESLLLGQDWQWPSPLPGLLTLSHLILWGLMGFGLLLSFWLAWRDRRAAPDWTSVLTTLLPVWVGSMPLYYFRFPREIGHHYLLSALPALLLLVGLVIGWRRTSQRWVRGITAVLVLIALGQTVVMVQALQTVAVQSPPGGMGTPLRYHRDVARALQDGAPIAVHTFDDNAAYAGDAATFNILLWDYPYRLVDGRSAILIPATKPGQPVHLLATFATLPAWEEMLANGIVNKSQMLPRRPDEPPYMAATIETVDLSHFQQATPVALANGAELTGWSARETETGWRFLTLWRISGEPDGLDYHQFNHFHDTVSAEPLAIHDARLSSGAWQQGDTLITWVDFDPAGQSGPFWVDVGMYTWPEVARSPRLDQAGDPMRPIRLGPFGE